MTEEIRASMENGAITYPDRNVTSQKIPWDRHPKFSGVYLKHLVTGADTEGKLSCHIVRIDSGAVLEEHIHESQWELHEVIEGEGNFLLGTKETAYYPGCMGIIPKGTSHRVTAGKNGMVLLAKFFPALL